MSRSEGSEPRFEVQPGEPDRGVCKGCGAKVFWRKTINGRAMILDSAAVMTDLEGRLWALSSQTHWSTCGARAQFTKPRKAVRSWRAIP